MVGVTQLAGLETLFGVVLPRSSNSNAALFVLIRVMEGKTTLKSISILATLIKYGIYHFQKRQN